jgi:hypothetical protein
MPSGPFEITFDQIMALRTGFTPFVNKLLEVEVADHGIAGHQLTITLNETTPDGGVDAAVRGSPGTGWIPAGDSAFQFKRSSQSALDCERELAKSEHAQAMLKAGGHYVMVLGGDGVPDQNLEDRRSRLVAKAIELDLIDQDQEGRIRVYGADALARWSSEFTALSIDPLLRGLNPGALDFARWQQSRKHVYSYFPDSARDGQIQRLRERLESTELIDIRIQGDHGLGKTRLALETLNDDRFRRLVAYIPEATEISGGLIESLIDRGRHVILVVDNCPAERHVRFVERLDTNPRVKLITIGNVGGARSSGPAIGVEPLHDDAMDSLLESFPSLSREAQRFVSTHSRGVPGYAIWLAQAIEGGPEQHAAELIARDDITTFITTYLPDGEDFFFAAILALFDRVGWDRDLRPQLELLAAFAGTSTEHLDSLVTNLASRNLVRAEGRYRAIDPLPVAIYLAAEAWRSIGQRIVTELFPSLSEEMLLSLFRRLAQLGRFDPATSVLPDLLAPDGPFGSLDALEHGRLGQVLTQLAIVSPDQVAPHLNLLIGAAEIDGLRMMVASRRSLVWTLEKLVWHTRTFELAADSLLKLAIAENESWANNATGTWLDLFGTTLPGTAATPEQRIRYLQRVVVDPRPSVRSFAAQAASKGLQQSESITVSGEIQGGVLVEPRGTPRTWSEVGSYRRAMIELLDRLRSDSDSAVADDATHRLLDAIHPMLDDQFAGEALAAALVSFRGPGLRALRTELERLSSLHRRRNAADSSPSRFVQVASELLERLPTPEPLEELEVLASLRPFDLEHGDLVSRIAQQLNGLGPEQRSLAIKMLATEVPAAHEFGAALFRVAGWSAEMLQDLVSRFDANPSALVGYLAAASDNNENAFDEFLDSPLASSIDEDARLRIAALAPPTPTARERLLDGVAHVRVGDAARIMFHWTRHLDDGSIIELAINWLERTVDQDDYNALVDWLNFAVAESPFTDELTTAIWLVLRRRAEWPDMSHQDWDWGQLAKRIVPTHADDLVPLLLDMATDGSISIHQSDEEADILSACVKADPAKGWTEVAGRLEGEGGWRLAIQIRGWLLHAVPVSVLDPWIGDSLERARVVAAVAHPGGATPTETATLLLDHFPGDEEISSSLYAAMVSGGWTGPWSDRVARQIEQLGAWARDPQLPNGVRDWATKVVASLRVEHRTALEREAERDF